MNYRGFLVYSRVIRYVMFFLTLIMMIFTVKVYLNDFNIEKSIAEQNTVQSQVETQDAFEKNFYIRYLNHKEDSQFFIAHDNLYANESIGEYIIKFAETDASLNSDQSQEAATQEEIFDITDPKDSWKYYLNEKYKKFISLF